MVLGPIRILEETLQYTRFWHFESLIWGVERGEKGGRERKRE